MICDMCGATTKQRPPADWFTGYLDRTVHLCERCAASSAGERLLKDAYTPTEDGRKKDATQAIARAKGNAA